MAESLAETGREPLSFNAPQSRRLNASSVQSESGLEVWKPQCAETEASCEIFVAGWQSCAILVVYLQISDDGLNGGIIRTEKLAQGPLCLLVGNNGQLSCC